MKKGIPEKSRDKSELTVRTLSLRRQKPVGSIPLKNISGMPEERKAAFREATVHLLKRIRKSSIEHKQLQNSRNLESFVTDLVLARKMAILCSPDAATTYEAELLTADQMDRLGAAVAQGRYNSSLASAQRFLAKHTLSLYRSIDKCLESGSITVKSLHPNLYRAARTATRIAYLNYRTSTWPPTDFAAVHPTLNRAFRSARNARQIQIRSSSPGPATPKRLRDMAVPGSWVRQSPSGQTRKPGSHRA